MVREDSTFGKSKTKQKLLQGFALRADFIFWILRLFSKAQYDEVGRGFAYLPSLRESALADSWQSILEICESYANRLL